jgi:hypothetical protein
VTRAEHVNTSCVDIHQGILRAAGGAPLRAKLLYLSRNAGAGAQGGNRPR